VAPRVVFRLGLILVFSGEVFKAVWNRTPVAKKTFRMLGTAKPDPKVIFILHSLNSD
jgi:hypothetical protein